MAGDVEAVLEQIRTTGVGVWGIGAADPGLFDVLASDVALPVGYLVAPVFDADGEARWELQIGPLRSAVAPDERAHYMEQLTRTARELDARTGEHA